MNRKEKTSMCTQFMLMLAIIVHALIQFLFWIPLYTGGTIKCEDLIDGDGCACIVKKLMPVQATPQFWCYVVINIFYYGGFIVADCLMIAGVLMRKSSLFYFPFFYHLLAFLNDIPIMMLFFWKLKSFLVIAPVILNEIVIIALIWIVSLEFDKDQEEAACKEMNSSPPSTQSSFQASRTGSQTRVRVYTLIKPTVNANRLEVNPTTV